jgi:hypothetical protein
MREYTIQVDVIVTRTYVVVANSEDEALARYRDGDAEIDENVSELNSENWDEQEDTARVTGYSGIESIDEGGR